MNCPNCGAANDEEARFCAECGTPLEDQIDDEAAMAGELIIDEESDRTIPAFNRQVPERARTVMMTQDDMAVAVETASTIGVQAAAMSEEDFEPEFSEAPPGDVYPGGEAGAGGGNQQRTLIIIGVVAALLLCCCCFCAISIGSVLGSDPELIEDIIRELSWRPLDLFVG